MAKLSDLIVDDTTGNYSHTKIWTHICYGVALVKFYTTPDIPVEIWLIVLGIVGSQNVLSKWVTMKYGQVDNGTQSETGKRESLGVNGTIDISVK